MLIYSFLLISNILKTLYQIGQLLIIRLFSAAHQSPKIMIFKFQQSRKYHFALLINLILVTRPKSLEHQIQLQKRPATMPFQSA